MTPLTLEQAKKIVLEKYPDAFCRENSESQPSTFSIIYSSTRSAKYLSSAKYSEPESWLSAAERIQKEKDK